MFDRYKLMSNIEISTELPKDLIIKLLAIIGADNMEKFALIDVDF